MEAPTMDLEPHALRRVFPTWSLDVPEAFEEAFIVGEGSWHAYDERRSISLTSMVITDGDRSVSAPELFSAMARVVKGEPVAPPPGLLGCGAFTRAIQPAPASTVLSGLVAVTGRVLVVSITSDDRRWSRRIWASIRCHLEAGGPLH